MNGYSKIRGVTNKSRSTDFSDLFSPPQTPKPVPTHNVSLTSKAEQTKQINDTSCTKIHQSFTDQEHEDDVGERFGAILSRSCSVSSSYSHRFRNVKQETTLQSAVQRAFSLRRSSSVSAGYCRIHDQCNPISPPNDAGLPTIQTRPKKKRSTILKACKRLLGL
uniref:Uncharacterized protein n=1 Tax=Nelumbo nucifera TaxID=4432 RepID=A0A822YP16_NELNU|nr:TPA_asm: hypothetical protein HUJ06_006574 [Nelumbo nucifera]